MKKTCTGLSLTVIVTKQTNTEGIPKKAHKKGSEALQQKQTVRTLKGP